MEPHGNRGIAQRPEDSPEGVKSWEPGLERVFPRWGGGRLIVTNAAENTDSITAAHPSGKQPNLLKICPDVTSWFTPFTVVSLAMCEHCLMLALVLLCGLPLAPLLHYRSSTIPSITLLWLLQINSPTHPILEAPTMEKAFISFQSCLIIANKVHELEL